ncbi:Uncharacterised protein [Elizabethkingia miricola]|nr:Uncharacterised protein [Elizabethkingia miricola]
MQLRNTANIVFTGLLVFKKEIEYFILILLKNLEVNL